MGIEPVGASGRIVDAGRLNSADAKRWLRPEDLCCVRYQPISTPRRPRSSRLVVGRRGQCCLRLEGINLPASREWNAALRAGSGRALRRGVQG